MFNKSKQWVAAFKQCVDLRSTEIELVMLNNALNEVCHALDVDEFDKRPGASKEPLTAIGELLDQMSAT